jgi:hypothetical protein
MSILNLSVDYRSRHSLSSGKNYEKAQVPAFSKTEFFLRRQVSLLFALLLRGANAPSRGAFHLGLTLALIPKESSTFRSNQQVLKIKIEL